jgi:hypothetical protein
VRLRINLLKFAGRGLVALRKIQELIRAIRVHVEMLHSSVVQAMLFGVN